MAVNLPLQWVNKDTEHSVTGSYFNAQNMSIVHPCLNQLVLVLNT